MTDPLPRWLQARLADALADTPVVLLNGARQTGKSTLAEHYARTHRGRYLSLDEPAILAAAQADPVGFVAAETSLLVIDEVQKAPELFVAIKRSVDLDRRPGRFLLTGSADIYTLPRVAESLAGRMEVLSLQPLAQGELEWAGEDGSVPDVLSLLFANKPSTSVPDESETGEPDLARRVCGGGFPEALARKRSDRRQAWFDAYVQTITQRDIRDLANIADLTALPRLLRLLAIRSGALSNVAELSRASGVSQPTLHRYLALLEMSFLYQPLPAWHANLGKRLIKAPKCYLLDSGLASALVGVDAPALDDSLHKGALLESFVLGELRRIAAAMSPSPAIHHYRSAGGVEVDFVIERNNGDCVAIELKASQSLGERHFRGLKDLQQALPDRFQCGVVLYGGKEQLRFGERLWALPISSLWQPDPRPK